jgi:hypothetical protein
MCFRYSALLVFAAVVLSSSEPMPAPRYTENRLVRPEGYREWMFVGSNLGMGYKDGQPDKDPKFHNIYIQPEAYRSYAKTGQFPDKTMLVMEVVSRGTNASINRQGQFGDRFLGVEVALKDEKRFPEKWAYFNFIGSDGSSLAEAKPFPKDACWSCHNQHGASDNVFVQFYPVLREARKQPAR